MTGTEILQAIQKLPLPEQRALIARLAETVPVDEADDSGERARREREFELAMLAEGFFAHLPAGAMTDAEFDEYEPLEVVGEPLSEQIIRERI